MLTSAMYRYQKRAHSSFKAALINIFIWTVDQTIVQCKTAHLVMNPHGFITRLCISPQISESDSILFSSPQTHSDILVWLSGRSLHYSDCGSRRKDQMLTAGKMFVWACGLGSGGIRRVRVHVRLIISG